MVDLYLSPSLNAGKRWAEIKVYNNRQQQPNRFFHKKEKCHQMERSHSQSTQRINNVKFASCCKFPLCKIGQKIVKSRQGVAHLFQ